VLSSLHEGDEDQQIGDAESQAEEGPAATGGAAPQGRAGQGDGDRAEEHVEHEQADEAEDEGRDGHAVGVTAAGGLDGVVVGGGAGCRCGELHGGSAPDDRVDGGSGGGRQRVGSRRRSVGGRTAATAVPLAEREDAQPYGDDGGGDGGEGERRVGHGAHHDAEQQERYDEEQHGMNPPPSRPVRPGRLSLRFGERL
jgi:hypothetical protein